MTLSSAGPVPSFRDHTAIGRIAAGLLMGAVLAVAASRAGEILDDTIQLALLVGTACCLSLFLYGGTLLVFRDEEAMRAASWLRLRIAGSPKASRTDLP